MTEAKQNSEHSTVHPIQPNSASPPRPLFVVGVQRSGTTMLRLMLDSHPDLAVPFETGFITVFFQKLVEYGDLSIGENRDKLVHDICHYHKVKQGHLIPDPSQLRHTGVTSYRGLVECIMSEYAATQGKSRWGDKTPFYITDIDVLHEIFPDCRIIHLVRDGRDVAVSQRKVSWASANTVRIAEDWRWKVTLARKIGNVLGRQYLEVRYEDLVLNTEAALRNICHFAELTFSEKMLLYHESGSERMPEKSMKWHRTSVRPPDKDKIEQWKRLLPVPDQILFEEVAGDALEMMGYVVERRGRTLSSRAKSLYYSFLKRW